MAEVLPVAMMLVNANAVVSKNSGNASEATVEQSGTSETPVPGAFNPILQQILASQSGLPEDQPTTNAAEGERLATSGEQLESGDRVGPEVGAGEELRRIMEFKTASAAVSLGIPSAELLRTPVKITTEDADRTEQANLAAATGTASASPKQSQIANALQTSKPAISIDLIAATEVVPLQPVGVVGQPKVDQLRQSDAVISAVPVDSKITESNARISYRESGLILGEGWVSAASGENLEPGIVEMLAEPRVTKSKASSSKLSLEVATPEISEKVDVSSAPPSLQKPEVIVNRKSVRSQQLNAEYASATSSTLETIEPGMLVEAGVSREKIAQLVLDPLPKANSGSSGVQQPVIEKAVSALPSTFAAPDQVGKVPSSSPVKEAAFVAGTSAILDRGADEPLRSLSAANAHAMGVEGPAQADVIHGTTVVAPNSDRNAAPDQKEGGWPGPAKSEVFPQAAKEVTTVTFPAERGTDSAPAAGASDVPEKRVDARENESETGRTGSAQKLNHTGNLEAPKTEPMVVIHSASKVTSMNTKRMDNLESANAKPINLPPDLLSSVHDQIAKAVSLKLMDNVSEMKVLLSPETLGEVTIKVRMEEGTMAARIDVNQPNVRTALEANLPQLKEALSSRGIQVERIDILNASFSSSKESNNQSREKTRGTLRRSEESDGLEAYEGGRFLGYNTLDYLV
jgi:flagellar hook-length control protein FliK